MVLWLITVGLNWGCGVVGTIEGGPMDTAAPVLLYSFPDSAATRVDTKNRKIFLYFNEFIHINNVSNILINPVPRKNMPLISEDLKRIVIKYDTLLEPNTTYSFDFKNEIGDLNENNRLNQLYYTFSTGSMIDTNKFVGRILQALTAFPDTISYAFLYPVESYNDSAVFNKKPFYIAKPDRRGHFEFKHIRPGTYYAFAFNDKDQNFRYSGTSESFDFLDTPIHIPQRDSLGPIFFTSSKINKPKPAINRKRIKNKWQLEYIRPDPVQIPMKPIKIMFYDSITKIDSSKIRLYDTTSIKDSLMPYQNEYIVSMQLAKVPDEQKNTMLLINTDLDFSQPYLLILDSGWVCDTNYITPKKADTLRLEMLGVNQYRVLKVFCDSCKVENPVLEILSSSGPLHALSLKEGAFISPYLRAGDYGIHLYEDLNKNNKQDIVDFPMRLHAERSFLLNQNNINLPALTINNRIQDSLHNPLIHEVHIRVKEF